MDKDLQSIQETRELLRQAKQAQRTLAGMSQEQLDKITAAIAAAAGEHARRLADMAVEETGFGKKEDKELKNRFAATTLYEAIRDEKTHGILAENRENLYKKNYNNRSHHAQHNKGIGDCTLNLVCDLNLLRIESRQTLHNLIQTASLFAGAYISSSRSRKSTGLLHGVRQGAGFLHVFIKKGQNFFAPFCLAVVI